MQVIREKFAAWLATPAGRRAARDLGFLALLFAAVGVAYGPSLKHPPRADQWAFIADTMDDASFPDSVRHTYSYNRTRKYMPGDTDLFRPVLFALLSAEKFAFGTRTAPPQAFGVVLHCAVCALLLVVLRQGAAVFRRPDEDPRERDWLVYATVAFFALNPCIPELVTWSHLHGYLLFLVFVLGSVACLLRYASAVREGRPALGHLAAGWAMAVLSAFTYELGQAFAVLAGVVVAAVVVRPVGLKRAAGVAAAFVAVAVGYQALNRIDMEAHLGEYRPDDSKEAIARTALGPMTLPHAARFGVFTAAQPFFPSLVATSYGSDQRISVAESLWTGRRLKVVGPSLALSYLAVALAGGLAVAGALRMARARESLPLATPLLFAGLYLGFAALIVLGRMNLRPFHWVIAGNSYYTYTALIFLLPVLSAAWHACGDWARPARKALAAVLLLLAAFGAEHVWETNRMVARETRPWAQPLSAVQQFVDRHGGEPGFSFRIDYDASDPVPEAHGHKITHLVFRKWMLSPSPRYRVVLRGGEVRAVPVEAASR